MAKKNTDLDVLDPRVGAEHQRLFGKGAKVSDKTDHFPQLNSIDEAAMHRRPRAENAGRDVHLPLEKALDREGRVKAKK
jgi:hypothetical protein